MKKTLPFFGVNVLEVSKTGIESWSNLIIGKNKNYERTKSKNVNKQTIVRIENPYLMLITLGRSGTYGVTPFLGRLGVFGKLFPFGVYSDSVYKLFTTDDC